jgi:hypothetical protein
MWVNLVLSEHELMSFADLIKELAVYRVSDRIGKNWWVEDRAIAS